jgi:HAD superfamily hydrolase (TIGR01509 family)
MRRAGSALLFDIDGTMADTDAFHLQAFNQVFGPLGHTFDRARFTAELQGFAMNDIEQRFLGRFPQARRTEIMAEKEAVFRDLARAHVDPVPGLLDVLDHARALGLPLAAVTNAPRANAEMMLAGLKIADRFQVLVIGDELAHGKPHPLPYLEGLRALGADSNCSLAFEDSRSGIASATAAGLATVGLMSSLTPQELAAAGAVLAIADFRDPRLAELMRARLQA